MDISKVQEMMEKKAFGIALTLLLIGLLASAFGVQPVRSIGSTQLLLKTNRSFYLQGENITITLLNVGNETVDIGEMPPWEIFRQQYEPVYPLIFWPIAWWLEPGENRTFTWNQYDAYAGQPAGVGYYVVRDTQGWGLSAYFSIVAAIIVPDHYPTIQEAINHANEGDTVFVRSGTYYEHVVVNKTLDLRGEDRNSTIVDGNNTGNVMTLISNNASISGFTFQHSAGNTHSCMRLDHVSGCSIFSNTANNSNSGDGIFLQSSERNNISDNLIINIWDGITFWGSSRNIVSGNTVVNRFIVGGTSIQFCYGSALNQVLGNAFLGIAQIGIRCYQSDSGSNVFVGNRVENHWFGIYADGSSNNAFYHNNIINSTISQTNVNNVNAWNNSCEGNYWSDYIGIDSDGDGVGDMPYVVNNDNIDHFPLMNPYWNPADINHDLKVDLKDVYRTAMAYGSYPVHPKWNPHCDINEDGTVDLKDYYTVCKNFARTSP
jgi:parallel beta-helix repeat protein